MLRRHLPFLTLLLSSFVVPNYSTRLFLKFYENATESGLVCNDGTPGGYYIRESPTVEDAHKWIFYQEGGGWCYDQFTCAERVLTSSSLTSSKGWKSTIDLNGIFDMAGTSLENANLVYLPYCSSDAHMADTQTHLPGYGTLHMRGKRLAHKAVEVLVGPSKENQLVLFGGTSAGGRGSMVTIDALWKVLHCSTDLRGLHDSGAYQDIPVFPSVLYTPFGEQCRRAYDYYNQPEVSRRCSLEYPEDKWKCLCGEYMLPLVETKSQVQIFQYDSYQLTHALGIFGHKPSQWTEEMCVYVEDMFRKGMLNTITTLASPESAHVVFGPSCYHHGLLTSGQFWRDVTVNGGNVSAQSQLLAWIEDDVKLDGVSVCDGVNCEETCAHMEISDAATACIEKLEHRIFLLEK